MTYSDLTLLNQIYAARIVRSYAEQIVSGASPNIDPSVLRNLVRGPLSPDRAIEAVRG